MKTYFASDLHLGLDMDKSSRERETMFCAWMDCIKEDCESLYLIGDVFDYWFEYKTVVPKGFVRLLGKLAEFTDSGIRVVLFTGNHDIWMLDYLENEIGVEVIHQETSIEIYGKRIFIGHGDGLGDPSAGFRFLRKFFRNKACQWIYRWIHPDVTIPFGNWWSRHNRTKKSRTNEKGKAAEHFLGEDKEYLVLYAKEKEKQEHYDYYIFGHRHIELDLILSNSSRIMIIGDWIRNFTFAELDENGMMNMYRYGEEEQNKNWCDLSDVC